MSSFAEDKSTPTAEAVEKVEAQPAAAEPAVTTPPAASEPTEKATEAGATAGAGAEAGAGAGAGSSVDAGVDSITAATAEISVSASATDLSEESVNHLRMKRNPPLIDRQRIEHLSTGMKFDDPRMKIPQPIIDALTLDFGFVEPSGIQAVTIPRIMNGRNIIAQAQTGSGKTVAFTIGMLARVDVTQPVVQAICLTPTRELAIQIATEAVIPMSRRMPGLRCELILKEEPGQASCYQGVCTAQIIVGTPGTVLRLMGTNYLRNLKDTVKVLVCDEADEMVEERQMGAETMKIKGKLHENVQTLLFSATFPKEVVDYCHRIVKMAAVITIETNREMVLSTIFQVRLDVTTAPIDGSIDQKKLFAIQQIYTHLPIEQSMIFATTQVQVEQIARLLQNDAYTVSFMHGGLSGPQRDEEIRKFKNGETKVLIATNVLSKGFDVPAVDLVIQYSLPIRFELKKVDPIVYLHRIGRCGRFGRPGTSVVLLGEPGDQEKQLQVEKFFNYSETNRMTVPWDVRGISALGDKARELSENSAFEPVELKTNVNVDDSGCDPTANNNNNSNARRK